MKLPILMLTVVLLFFYDVADAQTQKKEPISKKQNLTLITPTFSWQKLYNPEIAENTQKGNEVYMDDVETPLIVEQIGCRRVRHIPEKAPEFRVYTSTTCFSSENIRPRTIPGGFIDRQIETALIPAACRPDQVVYYIDGIMVRGGGNDMAFRNNSFRK